MKKSQLIKIIKEEIEAILEQNVLTLARTDKRGALSVGGAPPSFGTVVQPEMLILTLQDGESKKGSYEQLKNHFTSKEGKHTVVAIHNGKRSKPIQYLVQDTSF